MAHYEISWKTIWKSIFRNRRFSLLAAEIRKRLYSDHVYFMLRRDLALPLPPAKTRLPLTLRPLEAGDIPKLLNLNGPGLRDEEFLERINLLRMLKSGIQTCYVAVTRGQPCHLAWLIDSRENGKIESFFQGRIQPLAPDEILVEGTFTLEEYRRHGIQDWRRKEFYEKSSQLGKKWVVNYIRASNIPSLKGDQKSGFTPCKIREEKWRFFRRSFSFKEFPPGASYPLRKEEPVKEP